MVRVKSNSLNSAHTTAVDEKLATLLQFALKANKVVLGHDIVMRSILKKKAQLIICANDLSENSFQSISKCQNSIEMIKWGTKSLFYDIFGKPIGIIGILDENFKNGIKKQFSLLLESEE